RLILISQAYPEAAPRLSVIIDWMRIAARTRYVQGIPVFLIERVVNAGLQAHALDGLRRPPRRQIQQAVAGRLKIRRTDFGACLWVFNMGPALGQRGDGFGPPLPRTVSKRQDSLERRNRIQIAVGVLVLTARPRQR